MKNKKILIALTAALLLSSCGTSQTHNDIQEESNTDIPKVSENISDKDEPYNTTENTDGKTENIFSENISFPETSSEGIYSKDSTAVISLSDSGINVSGENVTVNGNTVTVTTSGTYIFSGTLSDGQIVVDSTGSEKVTLVLNGVNIHSSTTAAINIIQSSDKVELKIAENSVNIVSDGASRTETDESNAAIYSQDDLEIENSGTLYVKGNFEKGIHSKDDLEIREATVYIEAIDDGLRGKDSVTVESGKIVINCGGDGIRTNNETDEGKGYIEIIDGNIQINSETDAIQAVTDVNISGGNFTIVSGGGSSNSSSNTNSQWGNWGGFGGGNFNKGNNGGRENRGDITVPNSAAMPNQGTDNNGTTQPEKPNGTTPPEIPTAGTEIPNMPTDIPSDFGDMSDFGNMQSIEQFNTSTDETSSAKAIKATNEINISDGNFNIDSSDDAIHSNGKVNISGGNFEISSGDDGIHSDTDLTISSGTINISKSYEGIEGLDMTVSGGKIFVTASDDGLNAAGGSDQSSMNGRPGQNGFGGFGGMFETPIGSITITGGDITINASGDGIDSNGSLTVNGGKTIVYGPTDSANGPFDYTSEFLMNGGTFAAIGSSGMAQDTSSGSAQARVFVRTSGSVNSEIKITDSNNNTVFETVSPKAYGCILVSTPEMAAGNEYSFYLNDKLAGTVTAK